MHTIAALNDFCPAMLLMGMARQDAQNMELLTGIQSVPKANASEAAPRTGGGPMHRWKEVGCQLMWSHPEALTVRKRMHTVCSSVWSICKRTLCSLARSRVNMQRARLQPEPWAV